VQCRKLCLNSVAQAIFIYNNKKKENKNTVYQISLKLTYCKDIKYCIVGLSFGRQQCSRSSSRTCSSSSSSSSSSSGGGGGDGGGGGGGGGGIVVVWYINNHHF